MNLKAYIKFYFVPESPVTRTTGILELINSVYVSSNIDNADVERLITQRIHDVLYRDITDQLQIIRHIALSNCDQSVIPDLSDRFEKLLQTIALND